MTTVVYSDITKVMPGLSVRHFDTELFDAHIAYLKEELGADLIFPAHNYGFLNGDIFNPQVSRSECGFLSERFRVNDAKWRTETPVFSFCGLGKKPDIDETDVFSLFEKMVQDDGSVLLYGAGLSDLSFIGYFENRFFPCPYLYEKEFSGKIAQDGNLKEITITLPVKPQGMTIGYNWDKVLKDIRHEGIEYRPGEESPAYVAFFKLKELAAFFKLKLESNPFYLLDEDSYNLVVPKIKELKRGFKETDFAKD